MKPKTSEGRTPPKIGFNREETRLYVSTIDNVSEAIEDAVTEFPPETHPGFLHIKSIRPVMRTDTSLNKNPADFEPTDYSDQWCYEVVLVRRW